MRLGLKRDEVRLVPYTNSWEEAFIKAKGDIERHTGLESAQIEHIGSTAIKGMRAKPIIDILVGTDNIAPPDKDLMDGLHKADFLRLRVERPGEIVCARFTDQTYQEKTHFLHLTEFQSTLWENLIFFRNYLNENVDAKEEYARIKQTFVDGASNGINAYTDHKEAFVKGIFAKRTTKFSNENFNYLNKENDDGDN